MQTSVYTPTTTSALKGTSPEDSWDNPRGAHLPGHTRIYVSGHMANLRFRSYGRFRSYVQTRFDCWYTPATTSALKGTSPEEPERCGAHLPGHTRMYVSSHMAFQGEEAREESAPEGRGTHLPGHIQGYLAHKKQGPLMTRRTPETPRAVPTCQAKHKFRSFRFFELPTYADTGNFSEERPCFHLRFRSCGQMGRGSSAGEFSADERRWHI